MATRRRIGISNATTEAARRQLMQPVACFEKVWIKQDNSAGSSFGLYKWVKTDKIPHFEDENEVNAPLAPLPDEPEVVEMDEEMEQEEAQPVPEEKPPAETQEPEESKPPSPKPQLTMSTESAMVDTADPGDGLDVSLKPLSSDDIVEEKLSAEAGMDLELELGPAGLALDGVQNMDDGDNLLGGPDMDTVDPFTVPSADDEK